MTATPPMLKLEAFLPYRLSILAEAVSQSLAGVYRRRYGIAIPEWRVLATLGQFDSMTAKEIGLHSRMHKTKVSRAVATLEERRLVRRHTNNRDMRESFLELTSAGRRIYNELVPEALGFVDRLLAPLSEEERTALEPLLQRLTERAFELNDRMGERPDGGGG
ncbi:MarR family transcriptional regulator [Stappia taiwanensis]|uniref:MarR family transcriptional regulator n=1 Tax=Stappia taiwanensis TaxID=992267 RepID=A0A838XPG0_9HYPH|nr:MarR family transcriptional regulator [Stappia taiwanensis]MBA4611677.1 MarR family transcriptional regulator [Stappia taiwanensis]GGE97641.1 MarR family transcriptional regulator [Stappia taiwanensis]